MVYMVFRRDHAVSSLKISSGDPTCTFKHLGAALHTAAYLGIYPPPKKKKQQQQQPTTANKQTNKQTSTGGGNLKLGMANTFLI